MKTVLWEKVIPWIIAIVLGVMIGYAGVAPS